MRFAEHVAWFLDPYEPQDTKPSANKIIATIRPAEPPLSPFASKEFATPAAQDWNITNTKRTMEMIPETNFHVFIFKFSLLYLTILRLANIHIEMFH